MTIFFAKHKYIYKLVHILILFTLLTFTYSFWSDYKIQVDWEKFVSLFSISLLLFQLISMKLKKISFKEFPFWFTILSHLFMFGRVYLNFLNLDEQIFWNLITRYTDENLFRAGFVILCLLQSIFMGLTFNYQNTIVTKPVLNHPIKAVFITGIILLIISMPFRLYMDLLYVMQSQTTGEYLSLINFSGLQDDIAFLFVPSLIFIIASKILSKRQSLILLILAVSYFFVFMILTGDRRYPSTGILVLVLSYLYGYNIKIKPMRFLIYTAFAFISLNLLSIIRDIRLVQLTSLSDFLVLYGKDIFLGKSTIYETLAEFGISFFSVVIAIKYVPSVVPFQNGLSFISSIPSALPIGSIFPNIFKNSSMSDTINLLENTPVGATLIGDLYINFGIISFVFAFIAGVLLSRIFLIKSDTNYRYSIAKYYSIFYILINVVRASFFEVFRPSLIVYFFPLVLMWLINNYRYSSGKRGWKL